jgi:threonylcarbamoyladenosine tRNA methylthiotransferase MtaB
MRAAFYTLGCKLNQCESEALASAFGSRGFSIVPPSDEADLYIVNTCTVTSKSEQKARRMIRRKYFWNGLPQRVIAPYAYRCLARKCLE